MNTDVFILGTGIAGLVAAWHYRNYKVTIIGDKFGGQMASGVSLGPRIIQKDESTENFLKELDINNINTSIAKVLYYYNSKIYEKAPDGFIEKYNSISRDSESVQKHVMSENKNEIEYFDLKYNDLINILISKLKSHKNITIIEEKVNSIKDNIILTDNNKYDLKHGCYKINTILLPIFINLINASNEIRSKLNLKSKLINFYKQKNLSKSDKNINKIYLKKYNVNLLYTYFVNSFEQDGRILQHPYHRSTFTNDSIIYESQFRLDDLDEINYNCGNISFDVDFLASIPKIVNNDLPYLMIDSWRMFGRFAEWDQSIKLNELLKTLNKGKKYGTII